MVGLNTGEGFKETSTGFILKSRSFLTRNARFAILKYIYGGINSVDVII